MFQVISWNESVREKFSFSKQAFKAETLYYFKLFHRLNRRSRNLSFSKREF